MKTAKNRPLSETAFWYAINYAETEMRRGTNLFIACKKAAETIKVNQADLLEAVVSRANLRNNKELN
jgi:hypothetical protein